MSIYDYEYVSINNEVIPMSTYKNQVLVIVNTASKCGFTPQYEGLEKLYQEYKDKGFSVIGFPCGQFMEQEYTTESEIQEFCSVRYGVTFPLSKKVDVREENATPIFKYLTSQKPFTGLGKGMKAKSMSVMLKAKYGKSYDDNQIKWNFTKFLVDSSGNVIQRYEPTIKPEDMISDIEKLLK